MRARELGIAIGELEPGALDAITDVAKARISGTCRLSERPTTGS
jgi:hypothetical protein